MTRRVPYLPKKVLRELTERPLTEAELARRRTGVPSPTDKLCREAADEA